MQQSAGSNIKTKTFETRRNGGNGGEQGLTRMSAEGKKAKPAAAGFRRSTINADRKGATVNWW